MSTLALVRNGTGVAEEICDLFDDVITWKPGVDFDAIHFEGGADIHPSMYGVLNTHRHVGKDMSSRDLIERAAMIEAMNKKALIIGSCRGAQLACAFAGGKLVQDVTDHSNGPHTVTTHDGLTIRTTSVHHQQMYPWEIEHELLAWSTDPRSNHYLGDEIDPTKVVVEPEACYFPQINALAFQWHPEWACSSGEIEFTINEIKKRLSI
jgi:gamma-glutamyl-gamma-aminobutyrate hydrolase PuuD